MGRRLMIALAIALLVPLLRAEAQSVHATVTEFFQSLQTEPVDTIEAKVFSLIDLSASQGTQTQSTIAGMAFDFYSTSPVMGVEKVAIDVAKKYFLSGLLPWNGSSSLPAVESYVNFNESSQVGCQAPELWMESISGEWISLRGSNAGRKIVFFYSAQCSTCRNMSDELARMAASYDGDPITIFAVFTESDRDAWETYVREHFASVENSRVTFVHLWDPEVLTGFHQKYGVMVTPQLFLLDQQNVILGRRLNVEALSQMLLNKTTLDRQYFALFDRVFSQLDPIHEGDAALVVDAMASKSLNAEGPADSALFRESMLALFQYLRSSDHLELSNGALYLAENYIIGKPGFWAEEFVGRIGHQLMQLGLNPVDSRATDLLLKDKRGRSRNLLAANRNSFHLVVFHLIGCRECQEMIDKLSKLRHNLYAFDTDVTLVYVGENEKEWKKFVKKHPGVWRYLHDPDGSSRMRLLYDLDYVPHIYLLDADNVIIAKDIRVETLVSLLNHFSH